MNTSTRFSTVADTLLPLFWVGECEKHLLRAQKCISSNRIGLVKKRASMLTKSVSACTHLLHYLKKRGIRSEIKSHIHQT